MKEIWRDIPEYEGLYQASTFGRVRSLDRIVVCKNGVEKNYKGKILKPKAFGVYDGVSLCGKNYYIHKLVARTFPNVCGEWFNGCQVDHINTNIHNNKAFNLRVCSEKENHNNQLTRYHNSKAKIGSTPWNKGKKYKAPGISEALKGKGVYSNNNNAKPILQLTMDGELVKEWDCIKSASEALGINRTLITAVARGYKEKHSAGGFRWEYVKK